VQDMLAQEVAVLRNQLQVKGRGKKDQKKKKEREREKKEVKAVSR